MINIFFYSFLKQLKAPIIKSFCVQAQYLFVFMTNVFQKAKDNAAYFTQMFNDTIYSLSPDAYKPKYVVNLGNHNIPKSFYEHNYRDIMDFFTRLHDENRFAYGINAFV